MDLSSDKSFWLLVVDFLARVAKCAPPANQACEVGCSRLDRELCFFQTLTSNMRYYWLAWFRALDIRAKNSHPQKPRYGTNEIQNQVYL